MPIDATIMFRSPEATVVLTHETIRVMNICHSGRFIATTIVRKITIIKFTIKNVVS